LGILAHTLMVILLGVLFVAVLAAAVRERRTLPPTFFSVAVSAGVVFLCFLWWYLRPILAGWNQEEAWGYGMIHSAMASVNMLGWPVVLMVCLGSLLAIRSAGGVQYYWLVATIGFAAATLLLPALLVYHPEYVFPLTLGPLVLAGYAIAVVFEALRPISRSAAAGWFMLIPLCQLPSLASHFADGSRADLRTVAAYVQSHWTPGARVTGFSMGTFNYYAPQCVPAIPLSSSRSEKQLSRLTSEAAGGPLWVVVQSGRSGLANDLQVWLNDNCQRRLEVRQRRFDYFEYRAEAYLCGTRTRQE
ncbi:MAG: hypothetical protein LC753_09925, partial [Acidobacteria bacterium]|nr:hypothetical protein [Acidobacteriota bacterium]MCA1650571.1 hypothetical protein [Acidobacteriota bacterium]